MRRVVSPIIAALALVAAAVVSHAAPAPVYRPRPEKRTDLEKLQGAWSRSSLTIDGTPQKENDGTTLTTNGDVMGFGSADDEWKIALDPAAVPARIDLRRVRPAGNTDVVKGVYRLEADRLFICWRLSGEEKQRPLSFDPKQPNVWLHTYERKKR